MNRAEITRMAREAGMRIAMHAEGDIPALWNCTSTPELEAFAALVAAAEQERSANKAERFLTAGRSPLGQQVATAIRANKDET